MIGPVILSLRPLGLLRTLDDSARAGGRSLVRSGERLGSLAATTALEVTAAVVGVTAVIGMAAAAGLPRRR